MLLNYEDPASELTIRQIKTLFKFLGAPSLLHPPPY